MDTINDLDYLNKFSFPHHMETPHKNLASIGPVSEEKMSENVDTHTRTHAHTHIYTYIQFKACHINEKSLKCNCTSIFDLSFSLILAVH